jgi:hypothetical protein
MGIPRRVSLNQDWYHNIVIRNEGFLQKRTRSTSFLKRSKKFSSAEGQIRGYAGGE